MKSKAFGPLLLSLALLGGLSGCVIWDAGYTENKPVSRYVVPPADKFPITYSVSMSAERDDVLALPEVKGLRKKIEDDPSAPKYIKTVFGMGYKFEKGEN